MIKESTDISNIFESMNDFMESDIRYNFKAGDKVIIESDEFFVEYDEADTPQQRQ